MKNPNYYTYNYSTSYSNHHYTHNKRTNNKRWKLILPALMLVIIASLFIKSSIGASHKKVSLDNQDSSKAVLGSAEKKEVKTPPKQINDAVMGQQINAIIAQYPKMQIGVSVVNFSDDKHYTYGVTQGFLAASTAKLITATLFLHKVEYGELSLTQKVNGEPAKAQLESMIVDSNNDAWYAFNAILTKPALKAWTVQQSMKDYSSETNIDTPSDIAILLSKLYQGKILNKENTNLLLGYMQNANEAQYIVSDVPAGVKVYHKAGWLDDRINDAAIIDDGKNPYVLVIYSKVNFGAYNSTAGKKLYKDITDATVAQFL